ncbi:MAG: hypothetical protein WC757_04385 [Candidatus Paceibacterota bacterium]|jgi:hypothetical protein
MSKDEFLLILVVIVLIIFSLAAYKNKNFISFPSVTSPVTIQSSNSSRTSIKKETTIQEKIETISEGIAELQEAQESSVFKDMIMISSVSGASSTDPKREYITLTANKNNKNPIDITGWKLINTTGKSIIVGTAVETYQPGSYRNTASHVVLKPGDKAIIATGGSPILYSFRINKCLGYFTEDVTFIPSMKTSCPAPRDEGFYLAPTSLENDECMEYIQTLSSCRRPYRNNYNDLSQACRSFLSKNINYNGCFYKHSSDSDFYENEWRLFAGRNKSLWKDSREEIKLLDTIGKTVSKYRISYSY